jgi:hypothetical protein
MSITGKTTALTGAIGAFAGTTLAAYGSTVGFVNFKATTTRNVSGNVTVDLAEATEHVLRVIGDTFIEFVNPPTGERTRTTLIRLESTGDFTVAITSPFYTDAGALLQFTRSGIDLIEVKFDPATGNYIIARVGTDLKPGTAL